MTQLSARRNATRERLMHAAAEAFAEVGVRGASVEQICERAGFTRGAFYSNFDSIDQLCLELMQHQAARDLAVLNAGIDELDLAPSSNSTEQLRSNIRALLDVLLQQQERDGSVLFTTELRLYAVRTPSVLPTYRAIQNDLAALFIDFMERVLAAHNLRLRIPSVEACYLLSALCEHAVIHAAIQGRDRAAAVEDLATTVELLLEPDHREGQES